MSDTNKKILLVLAAIAILVLTFVFVVKPKREEIASLESEISELEDNEKVKRYLELNELESDLREKEKEAYIKVRKKNFKECRHLTVYTKVVHDYIDGKRYP